MFWLLNGKTPVQVVDIEDWEAFMRDPSKRRVAMDYVQSDRYGIICVSTIFLGYMILGEFFETLVMRERGTDRWGMPPPDDQTGCGFWGETRRYKTWAEAEAGHADVVAQLVEMGKAAT